MEILTWEAINGARVKFGEGERVDEAVETPREIGAIGRQVLPG